MKCIEVDKRQIMYSNTYNQLVELRAQLRTLITDYKIITTPVKNLNLKAAIKRSYQKSLIEDAIIVKRNSLEINIEMHKYFANEVNQNELIKIDMSEFKYEIFKKYNKENI